MKRILKMPAVTVVLLLFMISVAPSVAVEAKSVETENEDSSQKVIVIDPGCQSIKNTKKESVGPGSWTRKTEDLSGTTGVTTGTEEYEVNLQVAQMVKENLEDAGYQVELTRSSNDVNINNAERAMVANTLSAELYISIRSGAEGKDKSGVEVVCETQDNPYDYMNYGDSRLLSDALLGSLVEKTSVENNGVVETDDSIALNWCTVPNAIVMVGNINNPVDDEKLSDTDYQQEVALGIAAGVESYFAQR